MGRAPCCEKVGLKRGRWTAEEDEILINYIKQNGDGSWRSLPKNAGLLRCGKSCRLRWINYLRDDLKRGNFTREEEETIIKLHRSVGNKWSLIASNLPGRTDNEVKNYWNSHLSRKIYSFRSSINGAMLNTIDTVKMSNAATGSKRKGGRVSRAVAKKYNMNATNARANGATSGTREKAEKNEVNITSIDDKNTLVEEKGQENEALGPDHKEPDDLSLLLDQILEGDLMDLSEISWEKEKSSVDDHRQENANESDNGTNSQHSEDNNEDMYGCFSPLNTYFKDDLNLSWDRDYGAQEFTFWDGDDGLLWP